MKKKILVVTDMNFAGSGYLNIMIPLLSGLSDEYEIIVIGLMYEGQEHWYPFTIIPCKDVGDLYSMVHNFCVMPQTSPDVIVVGFDIPQQIQFSEQFTQYKKPYVAVTPLENGPLMMPWAAKLMTLNFVFFISELGKTEAEKAGLSNVDHLMVGIDRSVWRTPTPEEKANFRKGMDIQDDELVVLTVAENQERKNLSAAIEAVAMAKRDGVKLRYILVSRIDSSFGWNLRDLAVRNGVNREIMLMNKGMPQENLWGLYAMSDVFLLTSKAEGLGLPILEAMSVGLPVIGTDTGAITELLEDERGILVPPEYTFTDVWGNSKRDMIDRQAVSVALRVVSDRKERSFPKADEYIKTRTWDIAVRQFRNKLEEILNGKAE